MFKSNQTQDGMCSDALRDRKKYIRWSAKVWLWTRQFRGVEYVLMRVIWSTSVEADTVVATPFSLVGSIGQVVPNLSNGGTYLVLYLFILLIAIRKDGHRNVQHLLCMTNCLNMFFDFLFASLFDAEIDLQSLDFADWILHIRIYIIWASVNIYQWMINYIECAKIPAHTHADMYIYSIHIQIHRYIVWTPQGFIRHSKQLPKMLSSLPSWLVPYLFPPVPPTPCSFNSRKPTGSILVNVTGWVLVYWMD